MQMPTITIPKKLISSGDLVVVDKKSLEQVFKENKELRLALKAIVDGERALRDGRTRGFKEFLSSKFPRYAKD